MPTYPDIQFEIHQNQVYINDQLYTTATTPPVPPVEPPPISTDKAASIRALLTGDMTLAMEALPDGFERGDWANHQRTRAFDPAKYPNLQPWYVCYEQSGGNPVPTTGVLLSDAEGWAGYADGSWKRVVSDPDGVGDGSLFPENWIAPDGSVKPGGGSKAAITIQQDGGTLVNLGKGSPNDPRFLFHFWDKARYDQRKGPIIAFAVSVSARLDPRKADPNARYVLAAGCDKYGPQNQNGWDQFTGRFKKVGVNKRRFTAYGGTLVTVPDFITDGSDLF